jgi:DNA-binding transcriptional LysR family regulator
LIIARIRNTEDLILFVHTVELGSLSGAARDLCMSQAVVSYRIQRLEKYLEFHLLNRTTKHFLKNPNIPFQLVASDQFANFVEEKIDVTIRVGELRGVLV